MEHPLKNSGIRLGTWLNLQIYEYSISLLPLYAGTRRMQAIEQRLCHRIHCQDFNVLDIYLKDSYRIWHLKNQIKSWFVIKDAAKGSKIF